MATKLNYNDMIGKGKKPIPINELPTVEQVEIAAGKAGKAGKASNKTGNVSCTHPKSSQPLRISNNTLIRTLKKIKAHNYNVKKRSNKE